MVAASGVASNVEMCAGTDAEGGVSSGSMGDSSEGERGVASVIKCVMSGIMPPR